MTPQEMADQYAAERGHLAAPVAAADFLAGFAAALTEPTEAEVDEPEAIYFGRYSMEPYNRRENLRAVLTAFVRSRKQRSNDE